MQNNNKKARLVQYSFWVTVYVYLSFSTDRYVVFSGIGLFEIYTSYWLWIEVCHDWFFGKMNVKMAINNYWKKNNRNNNSS